MVITVLKNHRVPIPVPVPSSMEIYEAMEDFLRVQLFLGGGPFDGYTLDEDRGIHREQSGALPGYISAWTKPIEGLEPCNIVVRWVDRDIKDPLKDGQSSVIILDVEQW